MNSAKKTKYSLGLDLGIASIGWSLLEKDENDSLFRIKNLGVRIFPQLEVKGKLENQDRREKRSQRRLKRRKKLRLAEAKILFKEFFNLNFDDVDFRKFLSPFELKIKGLTEKLSKEELSIAIYHYIKYRGFKSNRKIEDAKSEGKLLETLDKLKANLDRDQLTISEYLWKNFMEKPKEDRRLHNSGDLYIFSATRGMYIDEINKLLDKQIELGSVTKEFKDKILFGDGSKEYDNGLFTRQRSFSEGPDPSSPFGAKNGVSLIEKMMGKCKFDQQIRAPKGAFSAESFVLLSFLNNLQIKEGENSNYRSLTSDEINTIYDLALTQGKLTYSNIFKKININVNRVKALDMSREQYRKFITDFKKDNKIDTTSALNEEQYRKFEEYSKKKLYDTAIVSLKNYNEQRKKLEVKLKEADSELEKEIQSFLEDHENFDIISHILMTKKVDTEIIKACKEKGFSERIANIISEMTSISQTINLSLDICRKIIPELKKGITYDKAMENIGFTHSEVSGNIEQVKYLPSIDECLNKLGEPLSNVNVKHCLVELRKLLNEIIKKYGYIDQINIEFARELSKNYNERNKILNTQRENMEKNIYFRTLLMNKYPNVFRSFKSVKGEDILKYRLWREQNFKCAYSNTSIPESKLFDNNECQIDHIMPYSKTFEDRQFNKVLVFTKYNQEKKDRLPSEAFKGEQWDKILAFVNDPNVKIGQKKKEILLSKEIDSEWKQRNINDTKYMSILAKKMIESFLKPNKCIVASGSITDYMKKSYGLMGLTHSYIAGDYRMPRDYSIDLSAIEFKSESKNNYSINFLLNNIKTKQELSVDVKSILEKGKKILSDNEKKLNEALKYFYENQTFFIEHMNKALEYNNTVEVFSKYIMDNFDSSNDTNQNVLFDKMLIILAEIQSEVIKTTSAKDRSNHLHHALDATMIACVNQSIIQKITKFAKYKEDKEPIYDDESGEIIKHPRLELPYKEFRDEVMMRVYERDENILVKRLASLDNYKNRSTNSDDIYVLNPSRSTNKNIKGAFTQETLFGYKNGVITKRVSVKDLKDKDVEKIINKDNGSKALYESVKTWMKSSASERGEFPILVGKGNYIKKVVIEESSNPLKRAKIRDNLYAANTECIRVDVYKKKGDDNKYYMVPIYYYQLVKEKQNVIKKLHGKKTDDIVYELMWAQGENGRDFLASEKLNNDYIKQASLPRYSLIELELVSGGKGLCYSAGATSGMFEVYSILGDDFDLIDSKITPKSKNQITVTISTIKNIKVRNISMVGKIN